MIVIQALLDRYYPLHSADAIVADRLFASMMQEGFDFAALSQVPDCLPFASSATVAGLVGQLIQSLQKPENANSYFQISVLGWLDPDDGWPDYRDRTRQAKALMNVRDVAVVRKFIDQLPDLPSQSERVERIKRFWNAG